MGLGFTHDIAQAAYVTSFLSSLPTLQNIFLPLGYDLNEYIQSEDRIHAANIHLLLNIVCQHFLSSVTFFTNLDASYINFNIFAIFKEHNSHSKSFQKHLSSLFIKSNLEKFNAVLTAQNNLDVIAWFKSVSAPEAGLWLTIIPKAAKYVFSADEFRVSLRYRFHIHQNAFHIRPGLACDCAPHPTLDLFGHHLTTGCGRQGYRHRTHDFLGLEIVQMLKYCGLWSKREENNCFQTIDDPDSQRRPDISVFPQHFDKKLVMDICITNPIPGSKKCTASKLTLNDASKVGRAAHISFQRKNSLYNVAATENNLDFLPIIFETTGLLHHSAKEFFLSVAKHAADEKKIHPSILHSFLLKNFSVALQKNQAASILGRSFQLRGHTSGKIDNYTLTHDFVVGFNSYQ
jgi:hypothetical protein